MWAKLTSKSSAGKGNPYQVLLNTMLDGFLLSDMQGHILDANPAYEKFSGYSHAELINMKLFDLDVYLTEERLLEQRQEVFAKGNIRFLSAHKSKSGEQHEVEISVAKMDSGENSQFGVFIHDRSSEVQALAEASESNDLYRSIFENASVGIAIANKEGELLAWNQEVLDMGGYDDADLRAIGRVRAFYYDQSDRDVFLMKLRNQGILDDEEVRLKKKDGGYVTALLSLHPIKVGEHERLLAIVKNVSEQAIQKQNLEQSEKLYRSLVKTSPDAILVANPEGIIQLVSPTALRIFGYKSEKELLGKSALMLIHEDDHQRVKTNQPLLLSVGHLDRVLYKFVRKDGRCFTGEFSATRVKPSNGEDNLILGSIRDISDRIRVQETLERQLRELEILQKVSTIGANRFDEDKYLYEVVDVISESLYPDHLGFLFLDKSGHSLIPHASYRGIREENMFKSVPLHHSVSGRVVKSGEAALITDVLQIEDFHPSTDGIRSELCVPITVGGKRIGVLNAESVQPNFFSEQDLQLLNTITDQVETTIERVRLFTAEREQRQFAEALQKTSFSITGILEYETILESILENVGSVVPHHAADIMIQDNGATRVLLTRGYSKRAESFLRKFEKEAGATPFIERVIKDGESVLLGDTYDEPQWVIFEDTAWIRSYISTPLRMRGEIIGILNLSSAEPNFFDEGSLKRLKAFANQTSVAISNAKLFSELEQSHLELSQAYDTTLEGWSQALDLRDRETEGHSQRVANMAVELAQTLDIPESSLINIRRGALLHDIGKVGIPDAILHKPDTLNEEEWVEMRRHPEYAGQLLRGISFLREAAEIPCSHHEHWDGGGYPKGIAKEDIPISARLFSIVDVWDALRSDRPYRKAWSREMTLEYISKSSGSHFDPLIVDAFFETFAPDWDRKNGHVKKSK